jgi:hypothetical protein
MKNLKLRTGITVGIAITAVSLAALLYVTHRATAMQALNGPFLCWTALDFWYSGKWRQFRKVSRMTLGEIYQAHREGSIVPSTLWLSRTLDIGTTLLFVAMVVVFFRV